MIAGRVGRFRVLYLTQSEVDEMADGRPHAWVPSWAYGAQLRALREFPAGFHPDGHSHVVIVREVSP